MTYWKQQCSARCATNRNYKYIRRSELFCDGCTANTPITQMIATIILQFLIQILDNLIIWQLPIHNLGIYVFQCFGTRSEWFLYLDPRRQSNHNNFLTLTWLMYTDWTWLTLLNPHFLKHLESRLYILPYVNGFDLFEMGKRSLTCICI